MSQSELVSQGVGDPFKYLASEIREMIATYLDCYENFDSLCLASTIMRKERRISTLLLTSEYLEQNFGGTHDGAFEGHIYSLLSKDGLSDENFALWKKRKLLHPLFSSPQDIAFRMNALYHRLMDCFNFGPEIVTWIIKKLPYSVFAHYAAAAFGRNRERYPVSLHDATDAKKGQAFSS